MEKRGISERGIFFGSIFVIAFIQYKVYKKQTNIQLH